MALSREERTKKVYELKENWTEHFKMLGLAEKSAYYYPKPVMKQGNHDPHMLWFPKELEKNQDLYTEPVDFSLNTETVRKLYKLKANPFYTSEYELVDTGIGQQYRIPFSEFVEVKLPEKQVFTTLPSTTFVSEFEDANVAELTARDWSCIHLKVPRSNKVWLNELIIESQKTK